MGRAPSLLSIVSVTSARPSGGRAEVPAKPTSSILPPRSGLTPCSPITQENASTTFDFPDPFGPTTQVIPRSNRSEVAEANDLNPRRVSAFRYTRRLSSSGDHAARRPRRPLAARRQQPLAAPPSIHRPPAPPAAHRSARRAPSSPLPRSPAHPACMFRLLSSAPYPPPASVPWVRAAGPPKRPPVLSSLRADGP